MIWARNDLHSQENYVTNSSTCAWQPPYPTPAKKTNKKTKQNKPPQNDDNDEETNNNNNKIPRKKFRLFQSCESHVIHSYAVLTEHLKRVSSRFAHLEKLSLLSLKIRRL